MLFDIHLHLLATPCLVDLGRWTHLEALRTNIAMEA